MLDALLEREVAFRYHWARSDCAERRVREHSAHEDWRGGGGSDNGGGNEDEGFRTIGKPLDLPFAFFIGAY